MALFNVIRDVATTKIFQIVFLGGLGQTCQIYVLGCSLLSRPDATSKDITLVFVMVLDSDVLHLVID